MYMTRPPATKERLRRWVFGVGTALRLDGGLAALGEGLAAAAAGGLRGHRGSSATLSGLQQE